MKKLSLLLIVLIMSAFVIGCGKDDEESPAQGNTADSSLVAIAELKTYLEDNNSYYGTVTGGNEARELQVTVHGELYRFVFTSNKVSVTFIRGNEIKTFAAVKDLIPVLENLKASNGGYYKLDGQGYYVDADTIVVKFTHLATTSTIELDKTLSDGQNIVTFTFEGKKYTVQLRTAYIDVTLYKELNQESATAALQSSNSNTILQGIQENILLPATYQIGTTLYDITWVSSNPGVISNTGQVVRPDSTTNVTLTATFTFKSYVESEVQKSVNSTPNVFNIPVSVLKKNPKIGDYYLEVRLENQPFELIANGRTVMEVVATLKNNDGIVTNMAGTADFLSDYGLESAQDVAAFENGQAKFKVTLPVGQGVIEDLISVKIATSTNISNISNLVSGKLPVRYLPDPVDGGANQDSTFEYTVHTVKSYNVADRVLVNVGGVKEAHLDLVKEAIINQVRVYNDFAHNTTPIELLEVISEEVISIDELGNKAYSFEVLTKLPEYSEAGVNYGNTDILLKDNQKNYWSVEGSSEKIRFVENTLKEENYFYLLDSVRPLVSRVVSFTEDLEYLPADSVVVVYSKPINRLTAEQAHNYVMNTKRLSGQDTDTLVDYTKYIRVLDRASAMENDPEGLALLEYKGIKELIAEGFEERQIVVIKLSRKFARLYLNNNNEVTGAAENKLAYENIKDWAGMTDHTDNNVVPSDDMKFKHIKPVGKGVIEIIMESPEQFVVKVDGVYGAQEDLNELQLTKDMIKVSVDTHKFDTPTGSGITLDSTDLHNYVEITHSSTLTSKVANEYTDVYGENYYVVELNQDYTRIMGSADYIYEGKYFSITMKEDKFDAFGNVIYKETLRAQVQMQQDVDSPIVEKFEILNKTKPDTTTSGGFWFKMNEPVQVFYQTTNQAITASVVPAVTPEINKDVLPPSIEYVMQNAADGEPVQGKVTGKIVEIETLHDREFVIMPTEELRQGNWRLVIKDFGDDVTNNRDTVTYNFVVERENTGPIVDPTVDNRINPYILWTFAVNDITTKEQKDDGSGNLVEVDVVNDYVYIMYSRKMTSTATDTATYDINGKQLKEGVAITTENVPLYRVNSSAQSDRYEEVYGKGAIYGESPYQGYLVKIRLPKEFLTGDDSTPSSIDKPYRKNILTVPTSLTATNDNDDDMENPTTQELLFDNNNGENQFELTFDGAEVYDHLYNGGSTANGNLLEYGDYLIKAMELARAGQL